jgi:hypothetical protein
LFFYIAALRLYAFSIRVTAKSFKPRTYHFRVANNCCCNPFNVGCPLLATAQRPAASSQPPTSVTRE